MYTFKEIIENLNLTKDECREIQLIILKAFNREFSKNEDEMSIDEKLKLTSYIVDILTPFKRD